MALPNFPFYFSTTSYQDDIVVTRMWRDTWYKTSMLGATDNVFGKKTRHLYHFHLFFESLFLTSGFSDQKIKDFLNDMVLIPSNRVWREKSDYSMFFLEYLEIQSFLTRLKKTLERNPETIRFLFFKISDAMLRPEINLLQERAKVLSDTWELPTKWKRILTKLPQKYSFFCYYSRLETQHKMSTSQAMGSFLYSYFLNDIGLYGILFLWLHMPFHTELENRFEKAKISIQTFSSWEWVLTDERGNCMLTHPLLPHPHHLVWTTQHSGSFVNIVKHSSIGKNPVRFNNQGGCVLSSPAKVKPIETIVPTTRSQAIKIVSPSCDLAKHVLEDFHFKKRFYKTKITSHSTKKVDKQRKRKEEQKRKEKIRFRHVSRKISVKNHGDDQYETCYTEEDYY